MTTRDQEPEPYILTPDEEQAAIRYAIQRAKDWYIDQHLKIGFKLGTVELKVAGINWEEAIGREAVLKQCNSNKQHVEWEKRERDAEKQRELARRLELQETWTAKQIFTLMRWTSETVYGRQLEVNDHNRQLITALCFFLSRDIRFNTELGYSFKKGLLIRGITGLGKTFLIKCAMNNELHPISVFSMVKISETVQEQGLMDLPVKKGGIICLDDVGTEMAWVKHYGTDINFFKNFIETYHLEHTPDYSGVIFTTNLSFDVIEEQYGIRVRSRIREMFNVVNVTGDDMRC